MLMTFYTKSHQIVNNVSQNLHTFMVFGGHILPFMPFKNKRYIFWLNDLNNKQTLYDK